MQLLIHTENTVLDDLPRVFVAKIAATFSWNISLIEMSTFWRKRDAIRNKVITGHVCCFLLYFVVVQYWSILANNSRLFHHDDVIKWKHFPRYWPFVRGIHRSPVNSPHKGQWRRALMFSLICTWINGSVNNHEAGDLRRHRAHYDVIVMGMGTIRSLLWASTH